MKQLAFSAWPLSANKEKISESTPRLPYRSAANIELPARRRSPPMNDGQAAAKATVPRSSPIETRREGRGAERTTRTCGRRTKYLFSSSEGVGEGINK